MTYENEIGKFLLAEMEQLSQDTQDQVKHKCHKQSTNGNKKIKLK